MADNQNMQIKQFHDASLPINSHFYFALCSFATILAFFVVILGAYTRLTDAGLGCPDWPGCYGNWIVQNAAENPLIHTTKAWTEMIHRYLAGFLGLMIFAITIVSIRNRMQKTEKANPLPLILPLILCVLVIFQALLGMWTVTLKLFPLIVMAHLLGGFATLSLLFVLTLVSSQTTEIPRRDPSFTFRFWTMTALIVLLIQLFLGGWTSANYAALACVDFPFCQTHVDVHLESTQIKEAFRLTAAGPSKIGKPLTANELMIVHMAHRLGALFTAIVLTLFSYWLFFKSKNLTLRRLAIVLFSLLLLQIVLGILNVMAHLPLAIAVAHNGVAALLLLALVTLIFKAFAAPKKSL